MPSLPASASINQAAFRAVFEAEYTFVWKSLRYFGVGTNDLGDVTHEVFLTVFRLFEQYDASRPLRPWLSRIAFHAACDYRKLARHKREVIDTAPEVEDDAPLADEALSSQQELDLVIRSLDSLAEDQRVVFVMHDIQGQSAPDIAAALTIPLNTVYSRLRLARQQFEMVAARLQLRRGGP